MVEPMDDAELRAQLEALHTESFGWALQCARRDAAEAEAVLQAVYLKVLDRRARYNERSSLKTWLFAVIKNTASERRRRRALHLLRLVRYEDAPAITDGRAESGLYDSELQQLFVQALGLLPARQREVLQLVFYHDMSLADAASVMKVSIGSARTHYDRGKKRLREGLLESGAFNEFRSRRKPYPEAVL
ncbi:MAG: RNA polymerase sigma factor [Blastocatellia bacterium]